METIAKALKLAALIVTFSRSVSPAADVRFTPGCRAAFADQARARQILTNRDDFIQALSPFDRAARMKSPTDPGEERFLRFLGTNALDWSSGESNRLAGLVGLLAKKLERWPLPLPATVTLIKTTGAEEGGAAYTRQTAILLSTKEAAQPSVNLLAHELFHVLSRNNPALRQRLYKSIGFQPVNELPVPPALARIRITNPDGVHYDWMIHVYRGREALAVVPVLYSSSPAYDPGRKDEFFNYLVFKLLAVDKTAAGYQALLVDGQPKLLDPAMVSGFYEQVGRNTDYILHPDEILAENFVLLLNGKTNVPTPRILSAMDRVLLNP